MMSEVRRTTVSPQGKTVAKPARPEAKSEDRSAWGGWRRNIRKFRDVNQGDLFQWLKDQNRSQSPRSSDEAANPRGAKGGRKVNA